jgi:hypothetical protein
VYHQVTANGVARRSVFAACALAVLISACTARADSAGPVHLRLARQLVATLTPENTSYRHERGTVQCAGIQEATISCSHTDCSGFLNGLLRLAYGLNDAALRTRFGTSRPLARHYFDAIAKSKGFTPIQLLPEVRPGDIIAVRYAKDDPENTDHNTGHVLLVAKRPEERRASAPLISGTRQWEVGVIDQSHSGHGNTDTRNHNGSKGQGLGEGILRLYSDAQSGAITGYSWSTLKGSKYHDHDSRAIVIGRLDLGAK